MQTHARLSDAEARRKAIGWLDRVGIPAAAQRIDAYPHEFSGGQRQRVVIALALCAEPALVIADEPTTALDVSIQAQIITLLKDLTRDHGTAVMLVTHDMGVIAETADRVAVMYAGRIVEIGPVAAVIRQPAHPYTDGLMASIPSLEHRVDRLRQIDGAMPRLDALPAGCRFHPRCPRVFARCTEEQPELLDAGGDPRRLLVARPWLDPKTLEAVAVSHFFDVSRPFLQRVFTREPRRLLRAVDDVSFAIVAGHHVRAGRRIRLRQIHHRPSGRRPLRTQRRRHAVREPGVVVCPRATGAAAADEHDLPGPLRVAEPALARTRYRRRTHPRLPPGHAAE